MQISITDRIRQAYLESGAETSRETLPPGEGDLAALPPSDLVGRVRNPEVSLSERDRIIAATVRGYRSGGPSPLWGAVLLEMLAPALIEELTSFEPFEGMTMVDEDHGQQLILEALASALVVPLRPKARFVDRRVVRRAVWQLLRPLDREYQRRNHWARFASDEVEKIVHDWAAYENWGRQERLKDLIAAYAFSRKRRKGSK